MHNNLDHIALILDGNKRWAKKNKLTNISGYNKGFENIKKLVQYSLTINLPNLTVFALSSENFKRSSIDIIYKIILDNFSKIFDELVNDKGVRIKIFGERNNLPPKILKTLEKIENISSQNELLNLNIAFNYGFKDEIKFILNKIQKKNLNINFDDDKKLKKLFYLGSFPDPDILIRTGGFQRLSNFIMYNLTYTEIFFIDTLWPDFKFDQLKTIINKFKNIKRTYGL